MNEQQGRQATLADILLELWKTLLVISVVFLWVFHYIIGVNIFVSLFILIFMMAASIGRNKADWITCSCGKSFNYRGRSVCPACLKSHSKGED